MMGGGRIGDTAWVRTGENRIDCAIENREAKSVGSRLDSFDGPNSSSVLVSTASALYSSNGIPGWRVVLD